MRRKEGSEILSWILLLPPSSTAMASTDECEYKDRHVFVLLITAYLGITFVLMVMTKYCCSKGKDERFKKDRMMYTEYMGRCPILAFLLGLILLAAGSFLAIFTPCFSIRSFAIDKNTENYIKSENAATDAYDALYAAISENDESNGWPYDKRRLQKESGHASSHLSNLDFFTAEVDYDYDYNLDDYNLDAGSSISRELTASAKDARLTFVYLEKKRPSNVFTEVNLRVIRDFERSVQALPNYDKYCRKESYYSKDYVNDDNKCATQASSVTPWFFVGEDSGSSLLDIDDTLKTMAQNGIVTFMDVYFSLDHRVSNLTRSTFWFEYEKVRRSIEGCYDVNHPRVARP